MVSAATFEFLSYEPSTWEAHWRSDAEALQNRACKTMLEEGRDNTDAWVQPMNKSFDSNVTAAEMPEMQNSEGNASQSLPPQLTV